MDQWGDHGLVCGCGPDRVTRHNLVRNVVHSAANDTACLKAVLENLGLLLPHDPDDDRPPGHDPRILLLPVVARPTSGSPGAPVAVRRPGISPSPALCASVLLFPAGVFSSVESRKKAFLNTASQCAQAGISFCPLVIEAVGGGWLDSPRSVVAWIASESNRCSPARHSDASYKIAQRISSTLHRENARAVLKRAPEQSGTHCCSLGLSFLSESVHDCLIFISMFFLPGSGLFRVGLLPFL